MTLLIFFVAGMLIAPAAAATTEVTVTKLASDDTTVLDQKTVTWQWMKDNLPVLGDGETIYYTQGPVFEDAWKEVHPGEPYDGWNPTEDVNLVYKDHGEFMGTDVKDLCNLVGGAKPEDLVEIKAYDGLSKKWPAKYIYTPNPRQGPMVIAWYHGKDTGYVDEKFRKGMRLYFFGETTNEQGMHVWGNWDMHESWDEKYWYYYNNKYPSASGNSVQVVNKITILSDEPAPADWSISLNGSTDRTLTRGEFLALAAAHPASFHHDKYGLLEGTNLSAVIGLVDDNDPKTVNATLAAENYTITVYGKKKGVDYTSTFYSTEVTDGKKTYVLGNRFNGIEINQSTYIDRVFFPLYLQGTGVDTTQRAVEQISKIELARPDTPVLTTITVTPASETLETEQARQFTAAELDQKGQAMTDVTFEWSSSNPSVGSVNETGYFTAHAAGTTTVTAKSGSVEGTASVTVVPSFVGKTVLFNGGMKLSEGTFTLTPAGGTPREVGNFTPFGALDAVSKAQGFLYSVIEKSGKLSLDSIDAYGYGSGLRWSCYVNDIALDDWEKYEEQGLHIYPLKDGDVVTYYYGPNEKKKPVTPENATTVVNIVVGGAPPAPGDWTLSLKGKTTQTVTKAYFEETLACKTKDHTATWTDSKTGDVWAGMPLWMLVAMVDDEETGGHYTFNDALAAKGYSVKVTSKDGYSINIPSSEMARSSGFIVANTLNGETLPATIGEKKKPCWPLQIKGSEADAGQLVGAIASIELVGLPEPDQGWTLKVCGAINDTITQAEFEEAGCHGGVEYTDGKGRVWSGVPLWFLVGVSDNIETTNHWTYDDKLAATNYTVKIVSGDGTTISLGSKQINRSSDYILADRLNSTPIADTDSSYPLRLVGDSAGKGLKNVVEIDLVDLIPGPAPEGSWNLELKGKIDYIATEEFFEQAVACSHHTATWTNPETGERWSGLPLWDLCGWVDDRIPHGSNGFNDGAATAGYTVIVTAGDGYSKEFSSKDIARNNGYIIANTLNGTALPKDGSKAPWPLRLVGPAVSGSNSVGSIARIELTEFQKPTKIPDLHIIKYGADGTTIVAEKTLNYTWMQENLKVYGDGETVYRFQGPTFDPDDLWNPEENKNANPGKVYGAVKGTSLKDLCDLVGGMETGTEITLEAVDGYQTKMNYTNVYAPLDRQGTAVLAWYMKGDGYVPDYGDGYRLFFITPDKVFGNEDMRVSFASQYHHFYFDSGIKYPSAGGLSARNVATIKIVPLEKDWTLSLEGTISASMSKHYFEEGVACEATHRAEYKDDKGRVWQGMPLWRVIGWVDDDNEHTGRAFNDAMTAEGYTIHIVASDGTETTIDSRNLSRYDDTNYILANSLDGRHIQPEDSSWPLRLVGTAIGTSTKGVVRIAFIPPGMGDAVQQIGTIPAGTKKNFTVENCTFSNLTLKAKGDINGGQFAVSAVNTLPQDVPKPEYQVYQLIHVLYPQSQDSLGEAEVTFSVPLSWLSAQGIAAKDVRLMRYHDGVWQQLPTTYLESRGGSAYFAATTPGFSYFAVGGTPTPTPTVSPQYRSSSSGGTAAISAISGSIPAGESKSFSVTETAFSTITVSAYDRIEHFLFTVKKASLPKGAPAPEGAVYEIQEVTLYKTDPSAIEGVTIEFAVDAAWLKAQGVSAGDVTLLRYVNGEWIRLETTFVEEKDGKAYYSARSPGFSFFAITAEKGAAVTPDDAQAPVGEVTTPAVETTTTTAPTTPQKSPVFWALPFIALGALLLLRRR
ncbi:MAG: PGF-pre-PGF domain-containing protein [Methanofollis sp.]|uniref:PGF-pre-PGF domain-containing protein n=1 Tax=Methanofollis sp. TaxID=2052835 RepID=UPI002608BFC4|nr:PGF-pre-PGF domain-containing protein [Methanofollis sp.]MDD4254152.1 PGF-pre-PGF domain-containing protein [Methanofollis sp.]